MGQNQTTRLALVTGASSGIGLEFARRLAADGYDLVLIARRAERLDALSDELSSRHGISTHALPLDLTVPGAVDSVVQFIDTNHLVVHTLVNNAGFGLVGRFYEIDRLAQLGMIQLNLTVLTDLTRCFLPGMIERGEGRILNVASSASFQPAPFAGLYHATKAFVLFLTEALSEELRGTGVTASVLCPGPVDKTEFSERRGGENKVPRLGFTLVDAKDVARTGLNGLSRGRTIIVPGLAMKLSSIITPRLPRWLVRRLIYLIMRSRV
ncbi:SDR family NAD(P)-dependent oxidoreductase [Bacteroidota bacterium]